MSTNVVLWICTNNFKTYLNQLPTELRQHGTRTTNSKRRLPTMFSINPPHFTIWLWWWRHNSVNYLCQHRFAHALDWDDFVCPLCTGGLKKWRAVEVIFISAIKSDTCTVRAVSWLYMYVRTNQWLKKQRVVKRRRDDVSGNAAPAGECDQFVPENAIDLCSK